MTYIYGIADPRDGIIRYIGATRNWKQREGRHGRKHKHDSVLLKEWKGKILDEGYKPKMILLDIANDNENAKKLEDFHILSHFLAGFPLLNVTFMGKGIQYYRSY